jgi:hypothetical protein
MEGIENVAAMVAKVEVQGTCSDQFSAVRDAFTRNLDTGQDIGASVAAFVDGEPAVDLRGRHFDGIYSRPFAHDTIVQCYSSAKTITVLCALVLADQGELDLDAPSRGTGPSSRPKARAASQCASCPGTPQACACFTLSRCWIRGVTGSCRHDAGCARTPARCVPGRAGIPRGPQRCRSGGRDRLPLPSCARRLKRRSAAGAGSCFMSRSPAAGAG